jgi:OsmC-like protein
MTEETYRWQVRVSRSRQDRATAFVRKHRFDIGAPVHFDEAYDAVAALEYVLAAIGADMINGFQTLCRCRRLDVDEMEAVVQGELNNPLMYLGVVGESGHPGLQRIQISVYVSSIEAEADIQRVWQEMLERSPLVQTFRATLQFDLKLQIVI